MVCVRRREQRLSAFCFELEGWWYQPLQGGGLQDESVSFRIR